MPIDPSKTVSAQQREADIAESKRLYDEAMQAQADADAFDKTIVSRRSRLFDRIGRVLFFNPEDVGARPDFFFVPGDRDPMLWDKCAAIVSNAHDNGLRRDVRALMSRAMLVVGFAVVTLGVLISNRYAAHLPFHF